MNSQHWTLLRRISATTSFAIVAIAAQHGYGQQDASSTPKIDNPIKATIRLRTAEQTSPSDADGFEFSPVPEINNPGSGSLLNSRFNNFPKADTISAVQSSQPAVQSQVAPASWSAPVAPKTATDPAATTGFVVQQQDQQGGEIGQPAIDGVNGSVKIIFDEQTGKLIAIGDPADVEIVNQTLRQIEAQLKEEERVPERITLRISKSEEIVESIRQIYDQNYSSKGKAEIIPLKDPNALLVFGSKGAIEAVQEIINAIEADLEPEDAKDFASFNLKFLSAADAKRRLDDFFSNGDNAEGFPVRAFTVVADYRSNVVVVRGNAQILQQAKLLIEAIDIDDQALSTKSVRVFQLQNAIASDLAIILQDAINGALKNVAQPIQSNAQGGGITPAQPGQDGNEFSSETTPSKLQLQTIGPNGKPITSGLLFDVRVTPDAASNSLIVKGPASAMPLVAELIKQLDRLPNAETVLKVFQIVNGDAEQLLTMLQSIFGVDDAAGNQNQVGGLAELPLQTASTSPGSALVNLQFAIDQRTNSIIATGPVGDLQVVEDLLNRLDEDLRSRRQTIVYRLSNSNVLDVEEALTNLLDSRAEILGEDPRAAGGAVLADQEIVIVPELGSNSLIISSLPENFPEIENIIKRLDRRPPMVKVKVMMAEVNLGSLEEFGVELGIQDSLLFDRSTSVANDTAGINGFGNGITGTGFDFLGNGIANQNASFREELAGQALSTLGLGQTNAALGYGGLVLSAGNESVNVLVRALKDRNCLRVLTRPHIMTLENLQGRVSVGQLVPRITSSTQQQFGGVSNGVEEREVGVILEITPRVSPDGMITMFVNVVNSSLGDEADGVAVAVSANGEVVNQAPINSTEAQTTILSRSGQTVVFSGLIQETKAHSEAGVPIISDLPVIGPLFKFESDQATRSELLIFMTPYLVDADEVVDMQNAEEMERMHWCLCDVAEVYGDTDFDPVHADTGAARTLYQGEDEGQYWSSQADVPPAPEVEQMSHTSGSGTKSNVSQAGFLQKMKLNMKKSPVAKIADRIRGNNPANRNDRNRRDFEELKRLGTQGQE